jgi:hypothetical protein
MRRSLIVVLTVVLVTACGRPAGNGQSNEPNLVSQPEDGEEKWNGPRITLPTEETIALPSGEFASLYPDPSEEAFKTSFPGLRRAFHESVLFAPGRLEIVDSPRSSFPRSSPLWQDTLESYMDDQVVARLFMSVRDTLPYYLVHTDGMSGDPAFYLIRGSDGEEVGGGAADVIAFPDSGDVWVYQRSNAVFPMRRRIRLADGRMEEVAEDRYAVGLQTVALKAFSLRRALDDSTEVASVAGGDSIEVVAGIDPPRSESVLLVRTRTGAEGWVRVPSQQCNLAVIKGICFLGD